MEGHAGYGGEEEEDPQQSGVPQFSAIDVGTPLHGRPLGKATPESVHGANFGLLGFLIRMVRL